MNRLNISINNQTLSFCSWIIATRSVEMPLDLVWKLQQVQNSAARLFSGAPHKKYFSLALKELQLSAIRYQAKVKVLILTYKA